MFTTCFFCSADLGRNDVLETLPVGHRVAFAEHTGRLWVVCRACERWNLSPLEERWEAIEACERLFRDTRLRVSTDNVGLARTRGGLDLVRIGTPLRPEFAAWRYGDQFGRRRKRQLLSTGAVVGAFGAVVAGGAWAGVSIASFAGVYANSAIWDRLLHGNPKQIVARVPLAGAQVLEVQRQHARGALLMHPEQSGDPFALRVEHTKGDILLTGADAARVAQQVLPVVNRFGGSKRVVGDAVRTVEDAGGPEAMIARLSATRGAHRLLEAKGRRPLASKKKQDGKVGLLREFTTVDRLALEMALHEESERRAMDGELAALEAAWREADEIARIADSLLEPEALTEKFAALRHARDRGALQGADLSNDTRDGAA